LINDVPDGRGDRPPHRPRTAAPLHAALAAALLTAAVAGCGGGGGEGSATGSTGASVRTATQASTQATTGTTTTTAGGNGGSGAAAHGQTPQQAVTGVLARAEPDNCLARPGTDVTEHYIHVAYGDTAGCIRAQNEGAVAHSLGAYSEKITGSTATVEVRPAGGIYDGEKLTVSLVKEDGRWKVDAIKSNAPVGP
jgi:hypothetical protein